MLSFAIIMEFSPYIYIFLSIINIATENRQVDRLGILDYLLDDLSYMCQLINLFLFDLDKLIRWVDNPKLSNWMLRFMILLGIVFRLSSTSYEMFTGFTCLQDNILLDGFSCVHMHSCRFLNCSTSPSIECRVSFTTASSMASPPVMWKDRTRFQVRGGYHIVPSQYVCWTNFVLVALSDRSLNNKGKVNDFFGKINVVHFQQL